MSSIWYRRGWHPLTILLLPWAFLFGLVVQIRRWLYRSNVLKTQVMPVPVLVVGNITVGGTGKTPFVIELAKWLQSQGYRPGIVSRGIGGKKHYQPYWVHAIDSPRLVGDEAILLAKNTQCPVVISIDRVAAVDELIKHSKCNVVISDDGLQHYRLHRDIEIAIIDGVRQLGNACLLPAGPLREHASRLQSVDFVVTHHEVQHDDIHTFHLQPEELVSVLYPEKTISLSALGREKIHAVAGIGNTQRFFAALRRLGFDIITHAFPDHHAYQAHELNFADHLQVVMTEKDAVKCHSFVNEQYWYLRVTAKINPSLKQAILTKLKNLLVDKKNLGSHHENENNVTQPICDRIDIN